MAFIKMNCYKCNREFQFETSMEKCFCLYCGAENKVPAADSFSDVPVLRRSAYERAVEQDPQDVRSRDLLLMWDARYVPVDRGAQYGDRFIGIWLMLKITKKSGGFNPKKKIQKQLKEFYNDKRLKNAMEKAQDPLGALYHELADSARKYMRSCKSDKHYGTVMLDFIKLGPDKLAGKAANDVAGNILASLAEADMQPYCDMMMRAIYNAYVAEFGEYAGLIDECVQQLPPEIAGKVAGALRQKN